MNHYQTEDTIAAIATPPGEGGVAIIRISGKKAFAIANQIFSKDVTEFASHTAHYGQVLDQNQEHVDDVLLLVMKGPRSYTGEDTIEINCHGGSLITRRVLDVILAAGARAASPGEFTYRAYLNGKIDLAQAEAVQELIHAKNEKALEAAESQLQGRLSERVKKFQNDLTDVAAILEAWVDFPEEGLEFASMEEVNRQLGSVKSEMIRLAETFHDGKILQDGISLCLIGCPNVGKSSLMNALLGKERAIVTHLPGTTRDVLEDQLRLNGLNFRLIDTAGIRNEAEIIEQEGIRRSRAAMQEADLVLFVLDTSEGLRGEDREIMEQLPSDKTICIWNKMDLQNGEYPSLEFPHVVSISAKEKTGLEKLHQEIDRVIWKNGPPTKEEVLITNVRHKEALGNAISSCEAVMSGLKSEVSPEFISMDMRQCLIELGKVIGSDITEDVLSAIFSKFCIGK